MSTGDSLRAQWSGPGPRGWILALGALVTLEALATPSVARAASWQIVGKMAERRHFATATLLADGTVLVTGGEGHKSGQYVNLSTTERFDPKTNSFTVPSPMHVARFAHAAVRLQDGRVLVLGGRDDNNQGLASAEVFDPATGTFALVGSMSVRRDGATATLLPDGRVLVVGGKAIQGTGDQRMRTFHASAELFDSATGTFQATGSLAGPRRVHTAVALSDGRVVILGGLDDQNHVVRRVEIYDPRAGTFAAQGETAAERWGSTATLLPDGKILLAGGDQVDPSGAIILQNSVEIYDPTTGQSKITGTLSTPREAHVAVALADGRVLVAGGSDSMADVPTFLRVAELVDPATGQVSLTEPMTTPRHSASAVLLPDGRALVLGGLDGTDVSDTAEVYLP